MTAEGCAGLAAGVHTRGRLGVSVMISPSAHLSFCLTHLPDWPSWVSASQGGSLLLEHETDRIRLLGMALQDV